MAKRLWFAITTFILVVYDIGVWHRLPRFDAAMLTLLLSLFVLDELASVLRKELEEMEGE